MLRPCRRRFITAASISAAAALFVPARIDAEVAGPAVSDSTPAQTSPLRLDKENTAVVFNDLQNDVLSETGLAWPLLHESLKENTR
jgi:hypothetical protein